MKETDPVKRLHNLCDFLEEQKHESPYSSESWDELQAENNRLITELSVSVKERKQLVEIHEDCASQLWEAKSLLRDTLHKTPDHDWAKRRDALLSA